MIRHFGRSRSPCALSWDDRYPESYNYVPSEIIKNLKAKASIIKHRKRT